MIKIKKQTTEDKHQSYISQQVKSMLCMQDPLPWHVSLSPTRNKSWTELNVTPIPKTKPPQKGGGEGLKKKKTKYYLLSPNIIVYAAPNLKVNLEGQEIL